MKLKEIRAIREDLGALHAQALYHEAPRPLILALSTAIDRCGDWIRESECDHAEPVETYPPGQTITKCRECGKVLAVSDR